MPYEKKITTFTIPAGEYDADGLYYTLLNKLDLEDDYIGNFNIRIEEQQVTTTENVWRSETKEERIQTHMDNIEKAKTSIERIKQE